MKLLSIGPLSTRQFLAKYFPKVFEANGDRTRVSWFTIQDNRDSGSMPVGPRAFSENISANKCRVDNWPIFLRYLNIVSWWIYKGKLVNLSFNGSDLKTFLRKIINSLMFLDHSHIISSLANQKKKFRNLIAPKLPCRARKVKILPRRVRNVKKLPRRVRPSS